MAIIHNIFSSFDIFGFPVFLNMNQKKNYQSWIGGCGTILMIAFFCVFFWQRFAQFIFMERVFTTEEDKYDTSPKELVLTQTNFMFAMNIQNNNINEDYNGAVYFDIMLYQKHRKLGKKVLDSSKAKTIKLEMCSMRHFNHIKGLDKEHLNRVYENNEFSKWLCPVLDQTFFLGGVFTSEDFLYLQAVVTTCDTNLAGRQCKVMTDQDKKNVYKFQFYHTNFLVNKNADIVPIVTYISDFLFFQFKPDSLTNWSDIFFREYFLKTEDNVWGYKAPAELKFPVFQQGDQREFTQPVSADDLNQLKTKGEVLEQISINIRRSPFSKHVHRSYEKIDQFLAYLGGFVATLIGIFGGLLGFFKGYQYQVELANQMYSFHRKETNDDKGDDDEGKDKQEKEVELQTVRLDGNKYNVSRSEYLQSEFKKYYQIRKPITITFKYYLSIIFCKKLFYGEEEKLIDTALQKIEYAIDLKNILESIIINQKGTDVTLGKKQKQLLDLIPKQELSTDDYENKEGLVDKIKALKGKSKKQIFEVDDEFEKQFNIQRIKKLYLAYLRAIDQKQNKDQLRMNKRILKQIKTIDPKIIKILEDCQNYQYEPEKEGVSFNQSSDQIKLKDIEIQEKQAGNNAEEQIQKKKKKKLGCI